MSSRSVLESRVVEFRDASRLGFETRDYRASRCILIRALMNHACPRVKYEDADSKRAVEEKEEEERRKRDFRNVPLVSPRLPKVFKFVLDSDGLYSRVISVTPCDLRRNKRRFIFHPSTSSTIQDSVEKYLYI